MPINRNEITKEMLGKAMQCNTAEDLIAYAKTEGVELTKEEAEAYLHELSECELEDGALVRVAGGAGITHKGQQQYCQNDFAIHTFSPSAKSLLVCHLYSP